MRVGEIVVTEQKYVFNGAVDFASVEGDSVESVTQQLAHSVRFVSQEFDRINTLSFLQLIVTDIERQMKIAAIKHVREFSGCSLKDGKDIIDRMIELGVQVERNRVKSEYGEFPSS